MQRIASVLEIDQLDHIWSNGPTFNRCYSSHMIVNIAEAKAQLSKLIDRVYHGEKITIAKNNLPIADLVVHKPEGKRQFGLLKGKFKVPGDFLEEDPEINEMFYGSDNCESS